jgi:hypothetical protein
LEIGTGQMAAIREKRWAQNTEMRNAGLSKSAENRWETADDVPDEELGKTNKISTVQ